MAGNYYGYGNNAESINTEFSIQEEIGEQLYSPDEGQPYDLFSSPPSPSQPQPGALPHQSPFLSPNRTTTRSSLYYRNLVPSSPNPHASNMIDRRTVRHGVGGSTGTVGFGSNTNSLGLKAKD